MENKNTKSLKPKHMVFKLKARGFYHVFMKKNSINVLLNVLRPNLMDCVCVPAYD